LNDHNQTESVITIDRNAQPPVITAPQALTLANEPKADVERYDTLRQVSEVRHAS